MSYEDDREDNAVNERFAECDCGECEECRDRRRRWNLEQEAKLEIAAAERLGVLCGITDEDEELADNLHNVREAAKQARDGSMFFLDALRRGGFFGRPN